MCINTNMHLWRIDAQQVAFTIQDTNDLSFWRHDGSDDLIWAFMHIANYRSWLKSGCISVGHDSTLLILKAIAKCGDPTPIAEAMKSYPRAEGLNNKYCALEGTKLFGSTKRKLNFHLVPNATQINATKWTTPFLAQTLGQKKMHMESLNYARHGVANTTSMLEIDYRNSQCQHCEVVI